MHLVSATCPTCGMSLPLSTGGACPRCLLRAALSPQAQPLPRSFGRYQLTERLGQGGEAVVFRAYDPVAERVVALKVLKDGDLASDADHTRFRDGACLTADLHREGIVPVLDVGDHEGQQYFTMPLMEGGPLSKRIADFRGQPRAAAALLAEIARAVHHAHQRLVLHRDLKPANILLDAAGKPHVADFGIARRLDASATASSNHAVGALLYMAPEQIRTPKDLTVAVDVYGLGAILHELLTGQPPARGATVAEIVDNVLERDPLPPRRMPGGAAVDVDLVTICMKCLRKEPAARYASAAGVAADLDRYLADEPIAARPPSTLERIGRVLRHHPVAAMLTVIVLALLLAAVVAAVSVARTQEDELRAEVLNVNAYAARALSGAVLFELRGLADELERAADDPAIKEIVKNSQNQTAMEILTDPKSQTAIKNWRNHPVPPRFDSLLLLDPEGRWLARNPLPRDDFTGDFFGWREYHRGGARLGRTGQRGVHVSRAYTSVADGTTRFGLTTPVYDAKGDWVGVLGGAVHSATALGGLILKDPKEPHRIAAVAARRDRDREADDLPSDWLVLVHHSVQRGSRHLMDNRGALAALAADPEEILGPTARATVTDDDHHDPIPAFEGRWLAGVAPVGGTPFAVVVQTRYETAVATNQRLAYRLRLAGGSALVVAFIASLAILGFARRHRSRR